MTCGIRERADDRVATVAVIGAGASGTLAATYLLRAAATARVALRIALIDRWGQHGLGRAYATAHPAHLLNSPVDRMSAVADDITGTTDPLLRGLLDSGQARPDPLRLGIEVDADGALLNASGTPSNIIFALGPPLRGQLYETTAIPEIRDQAAVLAGRLLAALRGQAAPPAAPSPPGVAGSAA